MKLVITMAVTQQWKVEGAGARHCRCVDAALAVEEKHVAMLTPFTNAVASMPRIPNNHIRESSCGRVNSIVCLELAAILSGALSCHSFEHAGEMRRIFKAEFVGNAANVQSTRSQTVLCL